ncbi:MAG: chromate transporter [Lachnospiraceae bacterium]|nr:chromate transporter [Lachnospiraceae bacterium]
MILLRLFFEFFKTGLFSVGGGLATLPFLYEISDKTGWITHADIADMIAVSESTPGAIGINMATYTGFKTAGILGALTATFGLALPSFLIILVIASFLEKFRDNPLVNKAFYGLRPASIAMITTAGVNVAKITLVQLSVFASTHRLQDLFLWKALLLAVIIFILQRKWQVHPILCLLLSAVVGIVFNF